MIKRWHGDILAIIKTENHGYIIEFKSISNRGWYRWGCTFKDVFQTVKAWKDYKMSDYFEPGCFDITK